MMTKASRLWGTALAMVVLLSSLLAGRPAPTAYADAPWSNAITLGGAPSLFPEIASDDAGSLHIVYDATSDDLNSSRTIMYTNNIGGSFKEPIALSNVPDATVSSSAKLAIRGDRIDVTFNSRTGGLLNARLFYTTSGDSGATWSAPVNLSGNVPAFDSAVTIDSQNTVHVAYGGYTGFTTDATYAIFYTKKPVGGGWTAPAIIAERVPGNSYNNNPDLVATTLNGQVTLNLLYMGNTVPGQELNKTVYSMRQINGIWTAPEVRSGGGSNYPKLVSDGSNTLWATWQSAIETNFEIVQTQSTNNGVTWSAPVDRSNNSTLSARPDIGRAQNGAMMLVWDDNQGDSDAKQDIWSAFSPNGASWANPVRIFAGPSFSKEVEVAGSCDTFHAVWHDAASPDGKFRIFYSQTGEPCKVVVPPVTFTPTRTSASPTTNPQVQVTLSAIGGDPNELRFSAMPFAADAAAPAWGGFTPSFTANAGTPETCAAKIYIQVRNTTTKQSSAVKSVDVVVDSAVQAPVSIQTLESVQAPRPAGNPSSNALLAPTALQPDAPPAGQANYTRFPGFYHGVGVEGGACSGTARHAASGYKFTPTAYPYEGFVPFRPFDESNDSNGTGYNEQQIQATVVVTDGLDNSKTFTRTLFFDDDPPLLADGSTLVKVGSSTTNQAVIQLEFTATVTDDSYGAYINQPNAAYWGVWVLATDSATPPTPARFKQYGTTFSMAPGTTRINNVLLVNGLVNGAGTRFVHVRFLDGAGNYTESVLTTPAITLQAPVQLARVLLPMVKK